MNQFMIAVALLKNKSLHIQPIKCITSIIFIITRILNHNKTVLFVGCNHDFVLLRPDSNEGDFFFRVDRLDGEGDVGRELTDKRAILNCVCIRHRCLDGDTF